MAIHNDPNADFNILVWIEPRTDIEWCLGIWSTGYTHLSPACGVSVCGAVQNLGVADVNVYKDSVSGVQIMRIESQGKLMYEGPAKGNEYT
jgi:hypothetical protein